MTGIVNSTGAKSGIIGTTVGTPVSVATNAADIGSGVLPVGVTGGSGLTALGTVASGVIGASVTGGAGLTGSTSLGVVTAGTFEEEVILKGMDIKQVKSWEAGAGVGYIDITVTNHYKYILLMQCPHSTNVDGEYPAVAKVSVNGSGVSTVDGPGSGLPFNAFGTVLTVVHLLYNTIRVQQNHGSHGFTLIMLQVGGA